MHREKASIDVTTTQSSHSAKSTTSLAMKQSASDSLAAKRSSTSGSISSPSSVRLFHKWMPQPSSLLSPAVSSVSSSSSSIFSPLLANNNNNDNNNGSPGVSPRNQKRQLQLLEQHYQQATQLLELQEEDLLYLLRDAIPATIYGNQNTNTTSVRKHRSTSGIGRSSLTQNSSKSSFHLTEDDRAVLEQCDYYVANMLMGSFGGKTLRKWPSLDLEGMASVLQTVLDDRSDTATEDEPKEGEDIAASTKTMCPALLVQIHIAIGLLRNITHGPKCAMESLQKGLWIQNKHALLQQQHQEQEQEYLYLFASPGEIGRTSHRLAMVYAEHGQAAETRSLLQAALNNYQKNTSNSFNNAKYQSLAIVANDCLQSDKQHLLQSSPSFSPSSHMKRMIHLFSNNKCNSHNKSGHYESSWSSLESSMPMLTIDEESSEVSLLLSPPSIPLLDDEDVSGKDMPKKKAASSCGDNLSDSTTPTVSTLQPFLASSPAPTFSVMTEVDHVANRVGLWTLTGFLGGAAYATFKGFPRRSTSLKVAGSCAIVATSIFGTERVANIVLREYGGLQPEKDVTRLTLTSYAFAGIAGGGLNGYLYQKKPLRGMFYFVPLMMCVAVMELDWKHRKEARRKEVMLTQQQK
jgi:hypothetical protein